MRKFPFIILVLFCGVFAGWLSARLMLNWEMASGSSPSGGWREVRISGDNVWSTYQAGHYLWQGKLQPTSSVLMFRRDKDDDGNALRSDCTTMIEGQMPQARWWAIEADNGNEARTLSAGTMIREPDSSFTMVVSRNAAPGNWLKLSGSRDYVIYLTLNDAKDQTGDAPGDAPALPRVKRLWC